MTDARCGAKDGGGGEGAVRGEFSIRPANNGKVSLAEMLDLDSVFMGMNF